MRTSNTYSRVNIHEAQVTQRNNKSNNRKPRALDEHNKNTTNNNQLEVDHRTALVVSYCLQELES